MWKSTEIENFVSMKLIILKNEGLHMIPIPLDALEESVEEASLFFRIFLTMDLKLSSEHFVSWIKITEGFSSRIFFFNIILLRGAQQPLMF